MSVQARTRFRHNAVRKKEGYGSGGKNRKTAITTVEKKRDDLQEEKKKQTQLINKQNCV